MCKLSCRLVVKLICPVDGWTKRIIGPRPNNLKASGLSISMMQCSCEMTASQNTSTRMSLKISVVYWQVISIKQRSQRYFTHLHDNINKDGGKDYSANTVRTGCVVELERFRPIFHLDGVERFLANSRSRVHVRYMSSSVRLSVVCNVRTPYSGDWNFRQCFYAICMLPWPSLTFG